VTQCQTVVGERLSSQHSERGLDVVVPDFKSQFSHVCKRRNFCPENFAWVKFDRHKTLKISVIFFGFRNYPDAHLSKT